ncbi:hypothetical protein A1O1_07839 [Capronia coronata CBS 617.96]|uniref:Uncharacterized protein n=1 Tax=Capronia coronata CBS 617.96 TaxID=1182541 RepID=W9YHL4_9EURO|nr:uncharacterized protein A1O1_07839 [Capronia coronata CBS 617.96]EXJ81774.1 hypothetical protein A1O1_07839 [Capronia coronata CBS 617.96]
MGFNNLPVDVFFTIIDNVLTHSNWSEGLRLRRINRLFDREIQCAFFDRMSVPIHQGALGWKTHLMKGQHLCRYLKGQMGTPRPRSKLAVNMQGAVEILQNVEEFSWDADVHNKVPAALCNTVHLGNGDRYDRTQMLVALTALAFLISADFPSLNRLTRYNMQAQAEGWAMMTAILLNDKPTVDTLLARQPEELRMFQLSDPLRMAVKQGNVEMTRFLLENGACVNMYSTYYNPDMGYRMVLQDACVDGNLEMIHLLLDPKYCMQTDSEEYEVTFKLIVESSARDRARLDVYKRILRLLILSAAEDVRLPLLHYIVDLSITNHTNDLVLLAIELGFDVNEKNFDPQAPLVHAVSSGELEIAETLVAHGARPMHKQDYDAVSEACRCGRVDMLEMLLTQTITVEEYGHAFAGVVLLESAKSWKYGEHVYLQLMHCFFDHGLDPNAANWGFMALNLAIDRRHYAVTEYLLTKELMPIVEPEDP